MIKLYNMTLALNCYKVRLLLSLLSVPHEKQTVDLANGEHKSPAFLKLNPFGQLPVVVDGDLVLRDSQAILVWIARKFGGDQWMTQDVNDEALVNAWLAAAAFEVRLGPYDARLAALFPTLCIDATGVAQRSAHALTLFNDRLTGREWVALDRPTVADVAAFPGITQAGDGGISLAPYPAVLAWADRVRQLPGYVALLDDH